MTAPRTTMEYPWGELSNKFDVYVDANWAGCLSTRRSTIGGVILANGRFVKSWCKTMPVIALSTAESELAAVTKGFSEGLGIKSTLSDFGRKIQVNVLSDATAAIGICRRQGLGRIRHLSTADLWCQEVLRNQLVTIGKFPGKENPADIFTKYLPRLEISAHMRRMSFTDRQGRAESAPIRSGTTPCMRAARYDDDNGEILVCDNGAMLTNGEGPWGLGGCLSTTCRDLNAWAWCDMLCES